MAATAVAEAVEGHGLPSLGPVRTNARALPVEPPRRRLNASDPRSARTAEVARDPRPKAPGSRHSGGGVGRSPHSGSGERVDLESCCGGLNPPGRRATNAKP